MCGAVEIFPLLLYIESVLSYYHGAQNFEVFLHF
jgi:hypothetical protein